MDARCGAEASFRPSRAHYQLETAIQGNEIDSDIQMLLLATRLETIRNG